MRRILSVSVIMLVVSAIGLSACGRRGPLERPPKTASDASQVKDAAGTSRPQRPFILDRLLQ